jgi:glycosyltransferase involved in cell wall biosynthesis
MKAETRCLFQILPSLMVGGAQQVVLNLLMHLDRKRYAPVVVCLRKPTGTHYETMLQQAGIPLYFLGKGNGISMRVYRQLLDLFKQYRPVIVHTHSKSLKYVYPLMFWYYAPVRVHTIHSVASHEAGGWISKATGLLAFRYHIRSVVPVAVSSTVLQSIRKYYGCHAVLIPNGVPTDIYTPNLERGLHWRMLHGIDPNAIVITMVARLDPLKDQDLLVSAFSKIQATVPLCLLLVGAGNREAIIRRQIEALGLSERVRLLGQRTDVPDILNASDIFVLCSRMEGNPMAIQEAMASGLPVIATAVGGVPDLIDDGVNGLLVPPNDETALMHALQNLVNQADLRRQIGLAARQYAVSHLDVRYMVRQYEVLYEALHEAT